jgi:DNA polymerase-3 subunit gamma/tau
LQAVEEHKVILAVDPQAGAFRTPQMESNLEKALQAYFQRPVKLVLNVEKPAQETPAQQMQREQQERQQAAEREIAQDPAVLALKERLGARVVPGSIKPLD